MTTTDQAYTTQATQSIQLPRQVPAGEVVAVDVSAEEYMQHYAADHHEWVRGIVIKMSPIHLTHQQIVDYLRLLLQAYFALRPIGRVQSEPFVLRLPDSRREPDLMLILGDNQTNLHDTYMDGPADICIEVVSPESVARDYGEKMAEYEAGGVPEYWIIDPQRERCTFYRVDEAGHYAQVQPDAEGHYQTERLPDLAVHVPTLWQDPLPNVLDVADTLRAMLAE